MTPHSSRPVRPRHAKREKPARSRDTGGRDDRGQAAVEFAAGNTAACIAERSEAAERFGHMEVLPLQAAAHYRVAMARFKAGKRAEAEESLAAVAEALTEPWMVGTLVPLVRENPMFAQWAASRRAIGVAFRDILERQSFESAAGADQTGGEALAQRSLPDVHRGAPGMTRGPIYERVGGPRGPQRPAVRRTSDRLRCPSRGSAPSRFGPRGRAAECGTARAGPGKAWDRLEQVAASPR